MKIRVIILSVYIMLLAAMPCCAFDNCPDDRDHSEQADGAKHEQGDEDGCGTCSPFFNCSACGSSFVATPVTNFNFALEASLPEALSEYTSAIPDNCPGKIWQPPRFV